MLDQVDDSTREIDVLVVGAGFAGLYMVYKLRQEGFSVRGVEAGAGVGGTWYWNRYPGARCDIPSIEYSYSFSPELEQDWEWSERYAAQPEILAYLEYVADRFDLWSEFDFETRVENARWDEAGQRWHVEASHGPSYLARHVVLATGALSVPRTPDLPGLSKFKGSILHTATWDQDVDLEGKRVALFGTGSSGIQVVPEVAQSASRLVVFQRTPNFAVPAGNRPLTRSELSEVQSRLPELREAARNSPLGWFDGPGEGRARDLESEPRDERFEEYWANGTSGLLRAFEDLLFDEESNSHATDFARRKIAQQVRDPEKARKLIPRGYPIGSRRMCSEIGFYDAFNRDNVDLVDVREEPVVDFRDSHIITSSGTYPADVLIFATGFDAMTGAIRSIEICGRNGQRLADEWGDGPRSYLGLAVSGFPNLFTITGPGSPSVLSNVVVSIEQHVDWVADCLLYMEANGLSTIEADSEAEQQWMEHTDQVAQKTVFREGNSWYHGRTRDGRKIFMPYVGGVGTYRQICNEVASEGYRGFSLERAKARSDTDSAHHNASEMRQ